MKSDLKKIKKRRGKRCRLKKKGTEKDPNPRNSGPTPVARGGSGAKAPPLAARPDGRDFGISTSDEGSSFGCYCDFQERLGMGVTESNIQRIWCLGLEEDRNFVAGVAPLIRSVCNNCNDCRVLAMFAELTPLIARALRVRAIATLKHQEITRAILCRLILNDIIIHIKFFNDLIMFSKIV